MRPASYPYLLNLDPNLDSSGKRQGFGDGCRSVGNSHRVSMENQSDGQYLAAWTSGDPRGFEALVDRYQAALLSHARALLGNRQGEDDVVQDAFLRLANKPPELPAHVSGDAEGQRKHLAAWLHTVTRNLCMDALRSETRRRRREQSAALSEASTGGMDLVEAKDTRERVERSLERLPDDQREVLVLRLLGDQSYREIAAITGKNVGTIGWLISVGMKKLAAELAPLFAPNKETIGGLAANTGPGAHTLQGGLS
jgi:RNA polymerase sigma-70 factor (ECF subfamily)